jgi:hypothetical protein
MKSADPFSMVGTILEPSHLEPQGTLSYWDGKDSSLLSLTAYPALSQELSTQWLKCPSALENLTG